VNGASGATGRGALGKEIAEIVRTLGASDTLTIAELAADGVVAWSVRRDLNGTPRATFWSAVPWSSAPEDDQISNPAMDRVIQAAGEVRVVFVYSAPDGSSATAALNWLRTTHPVVSVYRYAEPLGDLLRSVFADDPLTQPYELVTLRQTRSGYLELTGCQLFPSGAQRGDRRPLTVRCEPSDEYGTVFAVVSAAPMRQFRLVSVESANLDPGTYRLTAELRRPGAVRFHGLPAKLRKDDRRWSDLVAAVPVRLQTARRVHLVCAIEVSGNDDQLRDRLDRVDRLIRHVADTARDHLRVSLISYGPHSFDPIEPEEPTLVLTWAQDTAKTLATLEQLQAQGTARSGYPRAAQIECVLAEITERLNGQEGRPVLVMVGERPAFPSRVDPVSEILPCPHRNDWRLALQRLREYRGITFGAIRDPGPAEEIWTHLGRDAFAHLDIFDVRGFVACLDLLDSKAERVPFPLVEPTR
jgi:hypothetical protein